MKKSKDEIVEILKTKKEYLQKKYGVDNITLFGSVAREQDTVSSDIDILVKVKKDYKKYDLYLSLKRYLSRSLGRKVDLVYDSSMNPVVKMFAQKDMINVR